MNHLAHLLLAGTDPNFRYGGVLADHVRGRQALDELPPKVATGVRLHRQIDAWTDEHPAVRALLTTLQPPWRRYGGIILDVLFDHMLDRHWARFCDQPLEAFANDVDALLLTRGLLMPPRMQRFVAWANTVSLWQRYGERAVLADIFTLLARRHGREEPLSRGLEVLDARDMQIEQAFLELMPELQRRAASFRKINRG